MSLLRWNPTLTMLRFHPAGAANGIESVANRVRVELFFPKRNLPTPHYLTLVNMGLPAHRVVAAGLYLKIFYASNSRHTGLAILLVSLHPAL